MLPSRWSHLARHGLLGTTLLTIAASRASAEPCDELTDRSVGVVLGLDLSPKLSLIGGLEARQCMGDKGEVFARLEIGRGARIIAGSRIRPFESMTDESDKEKLGVEAGLALEKDGRLGAHLAATYGYHFAYLAAQGLFPLSGGERPTRASMVFGLSPWSVETATVTDGRPLLHDGRLLRPAITSLPTMRSAEDRAVRDHFASAAQFEYSSVWTFLRLAAELAAVNAPSALIARALDAADDEVRHAGLCADAAGGAELASLPMFAAQPRFTSRSDRALATLAVEAWLEGCLNETAAAEQARLAAGESTGSVSSMLLAIARDEQRHAELSWAVLAWAFEVAPAIARAAIVDAPMPAMVASADHDRALDRRGVASPEISRAAWAHAELVGRARLRALAA
jgi:hypothetical protein